MYYSNAPFGAGRNSLLQRARQTLRSSASYLGRPVGGPKRRSLEGCLALDTPSSRSSSAVLWQLLWFIHFHTDPRPLPPKLQAMSA